MQRFVVLLIASIAVSVGSTSQAAAADGGATIDTFPVTFTVTSAQCGHLPPTTTVNGSGTEKSVTTTRTDQNGVMTIENSTHAQGTATDDHGNTYVFNYSNSSRMSNTVAHQDRFSGAMTDAFSLSGNGPAQLHNGFVAGFTTDAAFSSVTWTVRMSHGDPISFAAGPVKSHCDPL